MAGTTTRSQTINFLGFLRGQLSGLQGIPTLCYELIQNADDVKDENDKPGGASRISFDVCDDALWVENDGIFRKIDFNRMEKVSWGNKREEAAGLVYKMLDEKITTVVGFVSVCTMHLAKGLEFRAVAVMACDDEIIPSQERIEKVTDTSDLEDVYNTERHLLYVACTRARDHLLVTSVEPESEFLDDLSM